MCDNSYATPLGQSPIALGVDLVVHSATKYLNGHSDVVAGVICGSESLMREIFEGPYMTLGAIPSPHDAWLLLRGLRTLAVRMERIGATTARVIEYLRGHPKVVRLHYPQAPDYPQRALSERQLRGASGTVLGGARCRPRRHRALRRCAAPLPAHRVVGRLRVAGVSRSPGRATGAAASSSPRCR
jgi:cystathionine beta-lyase/cystathionine gamma-synthase